MSQSRAVLILHTIVVVGLFLATAFATKLAFSVRDDAISVLVADAITLLATGAVWIFYGNECPFTTWENRYRTREGLLPYAETCIVRYLYLWLGMRLPKNADLVLIALGFIVPAITAVASIISV